MPNPDASSTPSNSHVRCRKGIHENITIQNMSNASPIQKATSKDCFGEQYISSVLDKACESTEVRKTSPTFQNVTPNRPDSIWSEGSPEGSEGSPDGYSSEDSTEDADSDSQRSNFDFGSEYFKSYFIVPCIFIVLACLFFPLQSSSNDEEMLNKPYNFTEDFERVQKQFDKQDEDFWLSIKVGVEEILDLNQPRVITFLYENDSMAIAKNIIASVSKAAVCHLSDCSQEPIDIEGSILNATEIQDDYGSIVSNYREKLKKSGVFIIQNLQLVPGKSAQALHLFCDEYNPVVNKALFLFTVKVNELPDEYTAISFLEGLLLKAWNDIGVDDKFDPLFTRISGTVLTVRP